MSHRAARRILAVVSIAMLLGGCGAGGRFRRDARALDSPSADARRESALQLGTARVPDDSTRRQLVRKLSVMAQSDPEALVRSASLTALAMQDPEAAVDLARRVRTDTDPMVRWDAVRVMRTRGGRSTVGELVEMTKDSDENVRREAVKSLGPYDDPAVVAALIDRITDKDISVAHAARESLMQISGGVDLGMSADAWRKWLQ